MPPRKRKIQSGETLSRIAATEKSTVANLLRLNPNIKNPNLIFAGSNINLPSGTTPTKPITQTAGDPTRATRTTLEREAPITPTGIQDVVKDRAGEVSAKDKLLERLTASISGVEAFDPAARRLELQEERGITEKREQVGTFEEEILKTTTLLDDLSKNIKERTGEFLVSEPQRARIEAAERAPIIQQLGKLTGGLAVLESKLGREEADITIQLGLEEAKLSRPLELLSLELGLFSDIEDLFEDDETRQNEASVLGLISRGIDNPTEIFETLDGKVSIGDIQNTLTTAFSTDRERELLELDKLKKQIAEIDDPINRQIKLAQLAELKLKNDARRIEIENIGSPSFEVGGAQFTKREGLTADAEKQVLALEAGLGLVDQIEDLYINAVGDESLTFNNPFLGGIQQRIKFRGVPLVEGLTFGLIDTPFQSTNFKIYQDFLTSNKAPIAKGIKGQVGNLTEPEQRDALKSFPDTFERPEVAKQKFENIRRQMTDKLSTLGEFDSEPDFGRIENDIDSIIEEETTQ